MSMCIWLSHEYQSILEQIMQNKILKGQLLREYKLNLIFKPNVNYLILTLSFPRELIK
jgi:hypothetical protein